MPERLPSLRSRQVVSALIRAGFLLVRQAGSHAHYRRGTLTVTVPMHSRDLARGTVASILRQAHLTVEQFRALL